jgi:hypothetical protein
MYDEVIARVEGALKTLGLEPGDAKTEEGQYSISKDQDTDLLMDVWKDEDKIFFQIMSPLDKIARTDDAQFYKTLLEENHNRAEAAFAIIEDKIFIRETIECTAFFSQERILSLITRIAWYSEHYQQKWSSGN